MLADSGYHAKDTFKRAHLFYLFYLSRQKVHSNQLPNHLNKELQPLFDAVKKFPITELLGSSGSFDSLAEMITHRFYSPSVLEGKTEYTFKLEDCETIYNDILKSTNAERLQIKGLVAMRQKEVSFMANAHIRKNRTKSRMSIPH